MGLLPLEFTECLQDSPYFRDSLISHEKELERTSNNMKELIKEVKNLLSAARSKLVINNYNDKNKYASTPYYIFMGIKTIVISKLPKIIADVALPY